MKSTKIMLATVATFALTWLVLALAIYLLNGNITYHEACSSPTVIVIMIIFGWIPSVIVGSDLDDYLL